MENETKNPYKINMKSYLSQLTPLFKSAQKVLPRFFKDSQPSEFIKDVKIEFGNVLDALPYIGGKAHPFLLSYIASAAGLACVRILERYGMGVEEIGNYLYETYKDVYQTLPGLVKTILRQQEFSQTKKKKLKTYAIFSHKRQYPDDWVFKYIEGNGKSFDYGVDYTECAVLKLYQRFGAEKYMPYVCVGDFASSGALRTGLTRTTTLQFGGYCCDFRYKKNSSALQGLPLNNLPEYKYQHK